MLGLEDFMTIHALVTRGVYRCDIAEQLGVHPKTVSRAVQRGGPPTPRRGRRGSLLDPYRSVIDGLLAEGVWNAVVIWRELQARGYPGEISIIRDYLRPKRALRPGARATVRFDGAVAIYDGEPCVAQHVLQPPAQGWVTVPDHHAALWADTLTVERRPLAVYEEVTTWS